MAGPDAHPPVELAPGLVLWLHAGAPRPTVVLLEVAGVTQRFVAVAGFAAVDRLADHLERRFGLGAVPGDRAGRFVGVLRSLVAAGQLPAGAPGSRRDRFAGWCADAGVPVTALHTRWRELVRSHPAPGCTFWLALGVSTIENRIWFGEVLEYRDPQPRDRRHVVRTRYDCLDRILRYLAGRCPAQPGGDPEQRLVGCLEELLRRGELGAGHAPDNRDRVAGWFSAAGAPVWSDVWDDFP